MPQTLEPLSLAAVNPAAAAAAVAVVSGSLSATRTCADTGDDACEAAVNPLSSNNNNGSSCFSPSSAKFQQQAQAVAVGGMLGMPSPVVVQMPSPVVLANSPHLHHHQHHLQQQLHLLSPKSVASALETSYCPPPPPPQAIVSSTPASPLHHKSSSSSATIVVDEGIMLHNQQQQQQQQEEEDKVESPVLSEAGSDVTQSPMVLLDETMLLADVAAGTATSQPPPPPPLLPNAPLFDICWSVAEERGYRYKTNKNDRHHIHKEIEDFSFPSVQEYLESGGCRNVNEATLSGAKLFIIADGHGGHEASRYFIARAKYLFAQLLDSCEWDFDQTAQQLEFKDKVVEMFHLMDQEYCQRKIEHYRVWTQSGKDTSSPLKPMDDGCTFVANIFIKDWMINCNVGDSRTVVAARNSFIEEVVEMEQQQQLEEEEMAMISSRYPVNGGVGKQEEEDEEEDEDYFLSGDLVWDFRLGKFVDVQQAAVSGTGSNNSHQHHVAKVQRSYSSPNLLSPASPYSPGNDSSSTMTLDESKDSFSLLFQSSDHNMMHPEKIHHIHQFGGKFLTPYGTFLAANYLPSLNGGDSTDRALSAMYNNGIHPLLQSRIYRPESEATKQIGVSNKRTLNLSATMGDLLFKVTPAVLSCEPDIEFIKLPVATSSSPQQQEGGVAGDIIIISATDGLWDHLKPASDGMTQNEQVVQWVLDVLDDRTRPKPTTSAITPTSAIMHSKTSFYVGGGNRDSRDLVMLEQEGEENDELVSDSELGFEDTHHRHQLQQQYLTVEPHLNLIARSLVKREFSHQYQYHLHHSVSSIESLVSDHSKTRPFIQRSFSLPACLGSSSSYSTMVHVEEEAAIESGLFQLGYSRYDDATAFVMTISRKQQ